MTRKTVASSISVSLISDGQSAPYYFQEYYAWSNVESTSDVTVSPFSEPYSGWEEEITTPAQGETYLWKKSVKYIWNDTTRAYDQEQPRYYRLNGSEAYFADLDNEMDSIACDFYGVPLSTQSVSTSLSLWKGSTRMPVSAVTVFDSETSGATRVYYDNDIEKSGVTISWTIDTSGVDVDLTARFTSAATVFTRESRHLSLAIQLSYADIQRSVCFTINGVRPGVPGESPEIFSVVPSENQIVLQNNGTRVPTGMTCNVLKTVGNVTTTPLSSEYKLYSTIDGVLSTRTEINTSTVIQTSGVTKNILYEVEVSGTVLDKETVPLLKDGKDSVRRWIELTPTLVELDYHRKTLSAITPKVKFWKQTGDNTPVNVSSDDDINGFYCDGSIAGYTHVPGWIESGAASFDTTNNVWTFPTIPSGTVINSTLSVMWYSEHQTGSTRYDAEEMYLQIQGHNGDDGTSPIVADIDNEMDSVSCKANGEVDSEQTVTTKVSLYNGSNQVSALTIIVRDTTSGGTAYTSGQRSGGVVVTWNNATGVISVTFKADATPFTFTGVSKVFCIQIQANIDGETVNRYLYFTVNGMRDGVLYKLLPSANVIKKTDSGFFPERIHCEVTKIDGGVPVVPAANEYTLQYRIDETGNWTTTTSATTISTSAITKNIQYQLKIQDGLADIETIPVVSDGNSSVIIDIDNDSDQFGTDIDSEVLEQQTVSTNVTMYEGASSVSFILTALTMTYEDGTSVPSDVAVCTGTLNTSGMTHAVSVTIKQTSGTSRPLADHTALHVRIEGQYEQATRPVVFTVGKVMSGKDGESPKIYQLELSSKSYAYGRTANNELVGNPSIKVRIKETVGNTSTIYGDSTVPDNIPKFKWGFDNGGEVQTGLTAGTTITIPAASASTHTNVWFQLTTGDKESVPILKDGNNGTDPIVIDIDNDSDLFGTDANSDVLVEQTFHTNVAMYQAITPLSFTITALSTTFEDGSSVGTNIATVSCYPSTGKANSFKVTAVIKQISGSTNPWTTHSALHVHITGTYGTATTKSVVFTIGKVNAGGVGESPVIYQLALSSRSFSYTRYADNTLTGTSSIQVGVKKTIGNDSTIYNTATTGIPTFKWWFDNGSAVQTGLTAGTTVTIPAASADTHSHVSFQLEGGSNDTEEVPILKGAFNGTSPYFADLDNEMDSMICDSDGNLNGEQSVTTNVALYYGQTKLTPSSIKVYRNNSEITSATTPWKAVVTVSTGNVVITGANGTPLGKEDFKITLTYNGQAYNVVMTVTGVRPGVNGESPVIPFLQPSVSCVTKHKDGTYSVSAVTCEALLRTANGVIPAPSGNATIYYSLDGAPVVRYEGPIASTSFNETLQFNLMYDLSLGDKETIPMILDGQDSVRIDLDNELDMVSLDSEGQVRFDRTITTHACIYDGASKLTTGVTLPSNMTAQYLAFGDVIPTLNLSSGTLTITYNFNVGNLVYAGQRNIQLTYGGKTYTAIFTISTTEANEIWQVMPTPSKVSFSLDSNTNQLLPSQQVLKCGYTRDTGAHVDSVSEATITHKSVGYGGRINNAAGKYINYRSQENGSWSNWASYETSGITVNSGATVDAFEFRITGSPEPTLATARFWSISSSLPTGGDGGTPVKGDLGIKVGDPQVYEYHTDGIVGWLPSGPIAVTGDTVKVSNSNYEGTIGEAIGVFDGDVLRFDSTYGPTWSSIYPSVVLDTEYVPVIKDGYNAVEYKIKPSATFIKRQGSTNNPTTISCDVVKTVGGIPVIASASEYELYQRIDTSSSWSAITINTDVAATRISSQIFYKLVVGGIEVDTTSVAVVKDGVDGNSINIDGNVDFAYSKATDMSGSFQLSDTKTWYAIRQADNHIYTSRGVAGGVITWVYAIDYGGQPITVSNGDGYLISQECYVDLDDGKGSVNVQGCLLLWSTSAAQTGESGRWVNMGKIQGDRGENAVFIDLDNQADIVACSESGKVRFARTITVKASIYNGANVQTTGVSNVSSGLTIEGVTPTTSLSNGVLTVSWLFNTGHTLQYSAYSRAISLRYNGVTYTGVFTLARNESTTVYQLLPSTKDISFSTTSANTYSPSSQALYCGYVEISPDGTTSYVGTDRRNLCRTGVSFVEDGQTKYGTAPYNIFYAKKKKDGTYVDNGSGGIWKWAKDLDHGTITINNTDDLSEVIYAMSNTVQWSAVTENNTFDIESIPIHWGGKNGVNGSSGCAININKDKLSVVNDVDGYVSQAHSQLGIIRVKYMYGETSLRPDIYYNGTKLTSDSTTQVENNLYVKLSTTGTDYQSIVFSITSASGENRLYLNGEQKTYTFTGKVTGKPDLDFSISLQGSNPVQREVVTGYLALSSPDENTPDVTYGRTPADIPMDLWSATVPYATQIQIYVWQRNDVTYSNGETQTTVSIYGVRPSASFISNTEELYPELNPNLGLLSVETNEHIQARFYVRNVQTRVELLCITDSYDPSSGSVWNDSHRGLEFWLVGGYTANGTYVQVSPAVKLTFNGNSTYTNNGIYYGHWIALTEITSTELYGVDIEVRRRNGHAIFKDRVAQGYDSYRFTAVNLGGGTASDDLQASFTLNVQGKTVKRYDTLDVSDLMLPYLGCNTTSTNTVKTINGNGFRYTNSFRFIVYFTYGQPIITSGDNIYLSCYETPNGQPYTRRMYIYDGTSYVAAENVGWENGDVFEIEIVNNSYYAKPYEAIGIGRNLGLWNGQVKADLITTDAYGGTYPVTAIVNPNVTVGGNCYLMYDDPVSDVNHLIKHLSFIHVDDSSSEQIGYRQITTNYD